MGEIFRRETAEHPEPFTGERLTTAIGGQIEIEHYHRYLFARALVPGLDVLDVASGEGYGSALLAQVARSVVGVEYSGPTVQGAVGNFVRANLRYLRADARALPLADACVDAVVSFGTIEHFGRQGRFPARGPPGVAAGRQIHCQHAGSRRIFPGRVGGEPVPRA